MPPSFVLACLLAPAPAGAAVAAALKAWDVPGAAVVVVRGDDALLMKGFGVRELGRPAPVTADTVFPLASCTKALTTAALASLADDGLIGWDDPVRKHLPGFGLSDPHADALLAVRDLLCHRTGLGGHDLLWYRAPWGVDETLRRARRLPLDYPFRGGFRYSTIPFLAAGRAMEKAAGEKWEKLVRARVCDPLGMAGVTFATTDIPNGADRAGGHKADKDGKVVAVPWYEQKEPNPAGSANATARDVARWLSFHLADGVGPDGRRVISVKNLAETRAPHTPVRLDGLAEALNPDTVQLSHGLGWLVYDHRGKKVVSHGGMIDGFRVQLTLLPGENLGVAVLANLQETRMPAALTNTLIDLYAGLPPRDWNAYFRKVADGEAAAKKAAAAARAAAREPAAKPALDPAGYAGEYAHPAYGTATVTAAGGALGLRWSSFECPLEHHAGEAFRVAAGFLEDRLVTFAVKGGKAAGLTFVEQEFARK
jgi:CubicO group peptidase (beta-lactamase class C family)